jgi:hypothetical protein
VCDWRSERSDFFFIISRILTQKLQLHSPSTTPTSLHLSALNTAAARAAPPHVLHRHPRCTATRAAPPPVTMFKLAALIALPFAAAAPGALREPLSVAAPTSMNFTAYTDATCATVDTSKSVRTFTLDKCKKMVLATCVGTNATIAYYNDDACTSFNSSSTFVRWAAALGVARTHWCIRRVTVNSRLAHPPSSTLAAVSARRRGLRLRARATLPRASKRQTACACMQRPRVCARVCRVRIVMRAADGREHASGRSLIEIGFDDTEIDSKK